MASKTVPSSWPLWRSSRLLAIRSEGDVHTVPPELAKQTECGGEEPLGGDSGGIHRRPSAFAGNRAEPDDVLKHTRRSGLNCRSRTSKAREGSRTGVGSNPTATAIYQHECPGELVGTLSVPRRASSGSCSARARQAVRVRSIS